MRASDASYRTLLLPFRHKRGSKERALNPVVNPHCPEIWCRNVAKPPACESIRLHYFASLITTGAWLLAAFGFQGLREPKGAFAALLGLTVPAALFSWLFFALAGPQERAPEVALVCIFLVASLALLLAFCLRGHFIL